MTTTPSSVHLSSTGSDSNDGSSSAPWATPEKCAAAFRTGTRHVAVHRGSSWVNHTFANNPPNLELSGITEPIVIEAVGVGPSPLFTFNATAAQTHGLRMSGNQPLPPVTLRGLRMVNYGATIPALLAFDGHHDLLIEDCTFDGFNYGMHLRLAQRMKVRRCRILNCIPPLSGVGDCQALYTPGCEDFELTDSIISWSGIYPSLPADPEFFRNQGHYDHGSSNRRVIRGNIVQGVSHCGLQSRGGATDIQDNLILDCPYGIGLGSETDHVTQGKPKSSGVVANNVITQTASMPVRSSVNVNVGVGVNYAENFSVHHNYAIDMRRGGSSLTAGFWFGPGNGAGRFVDNVCMGHSGHGMELTVNQPGLFVANNRISRNRWQLRLAAAGKMGADWAANYYAAGPGEDYLRLGNNAQPSSQAIVNATLDGQCRADREWPPSFVWAGIPTVAAYGLSEGVADLDGMGFVSAAVRGVAWATPSRYRAFIEGMIGRHEYDA